MSGLRTALGLFTVLPVGAPPTLTPTDARRALRWLPALGLALGAAAALPLAAVRAGAPHAGLLGAVGAVALLALLTRGLHLDGLADTADGLGSRAPAARALAIMRQSDIGPFGVVAILVAVLVDIAALAAVPHGTWAGCAALAVAAATGRLAVVHAAAARPAHPDGFGALVQGAAPGGVVVVETAGVLAAGGLLAAAVGASWWWWLGGQAVALAAAAGLRWHASRRLGGTTGDVYGALVETATALTLAGLCLR
ncbi:cobalamin-5'-phosphate synthase [Jatrophihabitans endophyticus]|uniref:Adenosylcobinamide-GDP ribazoletransferase n=1 Tax=Jatrophihabitans endophyticus TaxID=1206085 RepID=A0A1M5Q7J2_9ACTN|nr:adenosylcobinamide-GDP ribazoletransferase [Jatrophihabitans endophyticus]SHH09998.1 cobalamin-5'-phosphate synthase [Jatrophihabitans endophyticus]